MRERPNYPAVSKAAITSPLTNRHHWRGPAWAGSFVMHRTMSKSEATDEYEHLLKYLEYTLHELPAGVLYDANGADEKKCAELMSDTYRLEALAKDRGIDLSEFIATYRWHYERYPHYLSRHRHFGSYANYMAKHDAPAKTRA